MSVSWSASLFDDDVCSSLYLACCIAPISDHRKVGGIGGHTHWYEIIVEGTPCRMYFDIEFSKVANPGADLVYYLQSSTFIMSTN